MGRVVREFLKICSNPKNLMTDSVTDGWKRRPPGHPAASMLDLATATQFIVLQRAMGVLAHCAAPMLVDAHIHSKGTRHEHCLCKDRRELARAAGAAPL